MNWYYYVAAVFAVSCVVAPLAGRLMRRRALEQTTPVKLPSECHSNLTTEALTEYERTLMGMPFVVCPDCLAKHSLIMGPKGGMSHNIACGACYAEFWICYSQDGYVLLGGRVSPRGQPNVCRFASVYCSLPAMRYVHEEFGGD